MLHLLGVNLPDKKVVHIALQYFYGIGPHLSKQLCNRLSIHRMCKLSELSESQIASLSTELSTMTLESDLKRQIQNNVLHHRRIGTYRGRRHAASLPVRGQRTRTNAKTAKRLNGRWLKDVAVGSGARFYSSLTRAGMP
jgi:small subunit ribosomal protein S13